MSKKIYVGNLPEKITDKQLSDVFSKIGRVVSLKIIRVISLQENKNYGYVQMDTDKNTNQAIVTLDNTTLEGNRIKVVEAHFLDQDKQQQYYWKKRKS